MSRLSNALDSGRSIGTVSPEREGMSGAEKASAHARIKAAMSRESQKGMISFSGPHSGRYKYDADSKPSAEGSYVLKPGNHPKAQSNFHRILTHLGQNFGQQSVLKIKKHGEGTPAGALHYTDGSKKVAPQGHIHYNEPLKRGSGDTNLKGKTSSFTVNETKKE